jgi:hypothetical protein
MAGPYEVQAVVRLPGVIPGLAQIDIRVAGEGVEQVTAQPVVFDAGPEGAPPPDVATPVAGRPGTYHAELWFMRSGSFSVTIAVRGARGEGTVIVPVAAVPERQIPLYPWLGWLLAALGTLLFAGAVTIFRAAGTDALAAPGTGAATGSAGARYAVVGAAILVAALVGARGWWRSVEREYQAELYRPYAATALVDTAGGSRALRFTITDSVWSTRRARNAWERFSVSPIVPDHGKLMHLFLIDADDPSSFAHLHPCLAPTHRRSSPPSARSLRGAIARLPTWCMRPAFRRPWWPSFRSPRRSATCRPATPTTPCSPDVRVERSGCSPTARR